MRITIATGIYPPEIGGPATYALSLATRLAHGGHKVTVVTYSNSARRVEDAALPFKLVRVARRGRLIDRFRYFAAARPHIRQSDIVYALDWFAAGVPAAIAARLARVPYVVRIGGDYLWEQRYLQSTEEPITLDEFYRRGLYRRASYASIRLSIAFVLRLARYVVFNSEMQRSLYERYWGLPRERTRFIENALPRVEDVARGRPTKEIVFWGRFIVMKNLDTLLRAFAQAKLPEGYTLTLIGDGPQKTALRSLAMRLHLQKQVRFERSMSLPEVMQRVRSCRAFVLPSWTDISPNQVYESLAIGLPALVTKETYLRIRGELPQTFDPASVDELAERLRMLADRARYEEFSRSFQGMKFERDWDVVASEHMTLFESVLGRRESDFRVLQVGADRSSRGILFPGTQAFDRQAAYAKTFDALDIIGFSRRSDGAKPVEQETLRIHPTRSRSRFLYLCDALRVARKLQRPDVVSSQDPFEAGLTAWLIARRVGAPLHVQVHTDFLSPEYARLSLMNFARVLIAGFVLRRAASVRVVSERIRDSLAEHYRLRASVSVLPIYADLGRAAALSPDPVSAARFSHYRTKLLVVARLEPEKRVALALDAFAKSAPQDACLIIVGEGSERAALRRLAHELGITDRVFFEGSQDGSSYYSAADLVLVPSRYEGYGLVIVEALAAGKPVLSTNVGVAREAGAIVTSPERFTEALAQWFASGPREGVLKSRPYKDFDEYVRAYHDDLAGCAKRAKGQ